MSKRKRLQMQKPDRALARVEPVQAMARSDSDLQHELKRVQVTLNDLIQTEMAAYRIVIVIYTLFAANVNVLARGLADYHMELETAYAALVEALNSGGRPWRQNPPPVVRDIQTCLDALNRQDYETLYRLAKTADPTLHDLIDFARGSEASERDAVSALKGQLAQMKQESEQARIDALSPAQRRDGLCKWGIAEMMTETGDTQFPAAKMLKERLETVSRYHDLTAEQSRVLSHLQTLIDSNNPRPMIGKLMDETVVAVRWENGTIRL